MTSVHENALPVTAGRGIGNCTSDDAILHRIAVLRQLRTVHADNSVRSQIARILATLQLHGTVATIECARHLGAIYPPRWLMVLRARGHVIEKTWVQHPTECGRLHRVGLYVLAKGG